MKTLIKIFLLVLIFQSVKAQVEIGDKPDETSSLPKFYHDFLNFNSPDSGKTRVDAFIQVPYNQVQFVKSDKGFTASYTVTVSIFNENKDKLIVEKVWNEEVNEKDFEQTNSKNNYNLSFKSFYLPPGKYTIRSAIDDKESQKEYSTEEPFTVRTLEGKISLSDVILISKISNTGDAKKILPNVSGNVATQKDGVPIFFEAYSKAPDDVKLQYIISNADHDIIFQNSESKHLDSGKTQIFNTIKDSTISLGNYLLTITVLDKDDAVIASTNKPFFPGGQVFLQQ